MKSKQDIVRMYTPPETPLPDHSSGREYLVTTYLWEMNHYPGVITLSL